MRRIRTLAIACLVFSLIAILAACGDDGDDEAGGGSGPAATTGAETTTAPAGGKPVATVKVTETEYELDPMNPRIAEAGIVTFEVRNAGGVTHALEVEGPTGEVETEGIEPGGRATLRADLSEPGSYEWYCPVGDHEERGMKGRITVAGGGSGESPDDSGGREEGSGKDDGPGKNGTGGAAY